MNNSATSLIVTSDVSKDKSRSLFKGKPVQTSPRTREVTMAMSAEVLSREQVTALLAAAASDPMDADLKDVLTIILGTGARSKELASLLWTDVSISKFRITIRSSNGPGRRIPFGAAVLGVILTRRKHYRACEHVLGRSPRRLLYRISHRLRVLSGGIRQKPVTLHSLRLTFIARLMNSGANAEAVAAIAGCSRVLLSSSFGIQSGLSQN